MSPNKIIYLDYAASTPVDEKVFAAMNPYFTEKYGNPGALHVSGQESRRAIDDAREQIKQFLNADFLREVIFTGSATEANNIAISGTLNGALASKIKFKPHIITTTIEHKAVLSPVLEWENGGKADVTYLKVDKNGFVNADALKNVLRPETVLVSAMYANNEIGTIQPVVEMAREIKSFREQNDSAVYPLFHTDAVQAAGYLDMDVKKLGVDMLTMSAHKIYGPKGIGVLYIRDGLPVRPLIFGSGQEYRMRPGTESTPLIVGMGEAARLVKIWKEDVRNIQNMAALRDQLIDGMLGIAGTELNGARDSRLPNNANILFRDRDAQSLIIGLSEEGMCVSSGSACSARGQTASHVLLALGRNAKEASSSLRVTLGKHTTAAEIEDFLKALTRLTVNKN